MDRVDGPAVVLMTRDVGEADVALILFTRSYGKLAAVAKSGRKSFKRFCGILDILVEMDMAASRKAKAVWFTLDSAAILNPRPYLAATPVLLAAGSHLIEVTDHLMAEGQADPELYDRLTWAMDELGSDNGPAAPLRRYELAALDRTGHGPLLDHCASCDATISGKGPWFFSLSGGGLMCSKCRPQNAQSPLLSEPARQFLLAGRALGPKEPTARPHAKSLAELKSILPAFVEYQTGRKLKSLDFLRELVRFKTDKP